MTSMTGLAQRLSPALRVPYPGQHLGLRWRPLILSDAHEVYRLISEAENSDRTVHHTSASEIADIMEGGVGGAVINAIVGIDSDDRICAVALVRVLGQVSESAIALLEAYVSPHWRGRGLGRAILYWQEGRARQMLVEVFGEDNEIGATIANIVESHMTDRRRLCIAAGFHARRRFSVMYHELTGDENIPEQSDDYRIIPWNNAKQAHVQALHNAVFTSHFWPEMRNVWWEEAQHDLDSRWSFVAVDKDGEAAAYILVGRPVERWIAEGRTEAYVYLLGVSEKHRGKKLASALLGNAIVAAARSGIERIGLDVDHDSRHDAREIYKHLGFVDRAETIYYSVEY